MLRVLSPCISTRGIPFCLLLNIAEVTEIALSMYQKFFIVFHGHGGAYIWK